MSAITQQRKFALAAPDIVRWLISSEPDVYRAIAGFIESLQGEGQIDVAGPPSMADAQRYRLNRHAPVGLPTVRLRCRMVLHHLTGEAGVEVTASDAELEEINRWRLRRLIRADHLAQHNRIVA